MSKKRKFYVVWQGRQTGIYTEWRDCEAQIKGVADAKFKSFDTIAEAELALRASYQDFIQRKTAKPVLTAAMVPAFIGLPIKDALAVDAAWNTATGIVEYQGVYLKTNEKVFLMGPFEQGTNNIGEFLAVVHALAYLKNANSTIPVYSDSKTAIAWVRNKHAKTTLALTPQNQPLFELLQRAERWLVANSYPNKILKWETEYWGENPADFGRK